MDESLINVKYYFRICQIVFRCLPPLSFASFSLGGFDVGVFLVVFDVLAAGVVWLLFPVSGFLVVAVCTVVSSSSSLPKSRILESCSNCLKKQKKHLVIRIKYFNFDIITYLDLFSIKSDMA